MEHKAYHTMEDEQLVPLSREGNDRATEELFDRFVLRLAIAKQQREKITVNIH